MTALQNIAITGALVGLANYVSQHLAYNTGTGPEPAIRRALGVSFYAALGACVALAFAA